jgi:hypothetical protein
MQISLELHRLHQGGLAAVHRIDHLSDAALLVNLRSDQDRRIEVTTPMQQVLQLIDAANHSTLAEGHRLLLLDPALEERLAHTERAFETDALNDQTGIDGEDYPHPFPFRAQFRFHHAYQTGSVEVPQSAPDGVEVVARSRLQDNEIEKLVPLLNRGVTAKLYGDDPRSALEYRLRDSLAVRAGCKGRGHRDEQDDP